MAFADDGRVNVGEQTATGYFAALAPVSEYLAADPHHITPGDGHSHEVPWVVLPYVRVPSTDVNMTIALALAAVVMTQVMGFRALGFGYLTKFFNFRTLFNSPLGGIDLAVGLLELIGEIARILSFAFRLLGTYLRWLDLALCDELPGDDFALAILHSGVFRGGYPGFGLRHVNSNLHEPGYR